MFLTPQELTEKIFLSLIKKYRKEYSPEKVLDGILVQFIFEDAIEPSSQFKKLKSRLFRKKLGGSTEHETIVYTYRKVKKKKVAFIIHFLNQYEGKGHWITTMFHEFVHVFLDLKQGNHYHSKKFNRIGREIMDQFKQDKRNSKMNNAIKEL